MTAADLGSLIGRLCDGQGHTAGTIARRFAEDPDDEVRGDAARYLGGYGGTDEADLLHPVLGDAGAATGRGRRPSTR
ncbi:hypothetical protein [Micromonospora rubida]